MVAVVLYEVTSSYTIRATDWVIAPESTDTSNYHPDQLPIPPKVTKDPWGIGNCYFAH